MTVVSVFLGAKYRKWLEKGRLLAALLDDIIEAAEDDMVSEEEFSEICSPSSPVPQQRSTIILPELEFLAHIVRQTLSNPHVII
ncbi:MAG: hypothetical protein P8X91_09115 [Candidatus Bathyarchaeota archaeon]